MYVIGLSKVICVQPLTCFDVFKPIDNWQTYCLNFISMACVQNPAATSNLHLKSTERIYRYPIVNDSLLFALSYYQWAKSKNSMIDVTLSKMEGALSSVKDRTESIAADKFRYVDETVVNQLERFERIFPIILEPTKSITDIPANIFHQRIEPSIHRVALPMTQTLGFVSKTTLDAAVVMSSMLSQVIPTTLVSGSAAHNVLNKAEQLLDKYLPEEENTNCEDCEQGSGIYTTIKRLSKKSQRRVFKKVLKEIEYFKKTSLEKLEQLYSVIQEIKNSKEKVHDIKETIKYNQLIKDGLLYSDYLQNLVATTARSMPKFMCTRAVSVLDLINERLFFVRNTIQESSNSKLVSEKRINQAADVIDLVRSWIEYFADNIKDYYETHDKVCKEEIELNCDVQGSSSEDTSSEEVDPNVECD